MDPFIAGLCSFAESEGGRVPEMKQPMELLVDSLRTVSRLEKSEPSSLPVVDEHLAAVLEAAEGPVGDLLRMALPDAGWAQPYPEHAGEPDMDVFRACGFGFPGCQCFDVFEDFQKFPLDQILSLHLTC